MKTTKRLHKQLNKDLDMRPKSSANGRLINVAMALAASFLVAAFASAVDTLPILWEAGGQTAGNDGAGQAARIATDASGNVAVVSG
ncbi:MAG: hypothetical protein H0V54_07560, partial [Chthoniobacterales bacterium]|nr:hypothetical protein [Chthoniobacterales bacterium]